jgi:hypothetical protein
MALDDFRNERIKKLERLKKAGMDPYPASSARTHAVAEAVADLTCWLMRSGLS